jgi:Raf kinase inhibitor-like YbhB/YbcL family protein
MRTVVRTAGALPLALALALGGCGGGSSSPAAGSSVTTPSGSGVTSTASLSSSDAVATVESTPIAKATYDHWLAVTTALSGSSAQGTGASGESPKDQTMAFLTSGEWVLGEAAAQRVNVSEAAVHKRLREVQAKQFKTTAELRKYLAKNGETEADLLLRVKLELLESAISRRVTAAKHTAAQRQAALASFQARFQKQWKARTSCKAEYVMENCREDKNPPAPSSTTAHGASAGGSSTSSSAASTGSSSTAGRSSSSGETYSSPGSLTLSSSAFERNGAIPARYTCDGANVSPPLAWQNVPAHTAELVLFVIDDSSDGTTGGIRWIVAGIEPNQSEVKAGTVPSGAVVGQNSAGTIGYGGICPAKGKTDDVEFVLYALRKKIALSSGFTPAIAEHEYGGSELASATTYAFYTRP